VIVFVGRPNAFDDFLEKLATAIGPRLPLVERTEVLAIHRLRAMESGGLAESRLGSAPRIPKQRIGHRWKRCCDERMPMSLCASFRGAERQAAPGDPSSRGPKSASSIKTWRSAMSCVVWNPAAPYRSLAVT
jgi:hypothetical protein